MKYVIMMTVLCLLVGCGQSSGKNPITFASPTPSASPVANVFSVGANTKLLMKFNGDWSDETGVHAVAVSGATIASSTNANFVAASSQSVDLGYSTDFEFGSSDFTIEFYVSTTTSAGYLLAKSATPCTAVVNPYFFSTDGAGKAHFTYTLSNGTNWSVDGTSSVNNGQFHHIAVSRSSGTIQLWVDGVAEGTPRLNVTLPIMTNTNHTYLGWLGCGGANYSTAVLDDVRITKGTGLYTANFTPPAKD